MNERRVFGEWLLRGRRVERRGRKSDESDGESPPYQSGIFLVSTRNPRICHINRLLDI